MWPFYNMLGEEKLEEAPYHKCQLFQDSQMLQKPLHLNLNLSLIQLKSPTYDVIEL